MPGHGNMFHPPAWWDRGGSPAGSFFFKLWFFVWWQPVFGNHFRVDDCDDTLSLVIMVGDALGGKRNWKRIHLQVVLNEHSALNVGGKVSESQGIKKLQVVVVEFWTLEPTMSSAIITMGRSPTACPFGRTSLSNKISSWFFFSLFPLQVQQQRVHTRSPHTSRRHGTILGHLSPPGVVRAISINAAANR